MGSLKKERFYPDMGKIRLAEDISQKVPGLEADVLASMNLEDLKQLMVSLRRDGSISENEEILPIDQNDVESATKASDDNTPRDAREIRHAWSSPS